MLILTHPAAAVTATATSIATITTITTLNNTIYRTNTKLISRFRIACINAASSLSQMQRHISLLLIICCCADLPTHCVAIGYSYSRFVGPVSGPEHKVLVYDAASGGTRVDFMAKPEYEFAYGVEDGTTRVLQNRKESREGDAVKGVYSVVDPDGTLRVVKYTADDVNGFQAEIITNGVTTIHGHDKDNQQHDAAAHVANGKDTAANWQMVHKLQRPRLHEVQHVVGNRNEVGVGAGALNDAAGEDNATVNHDDASSKQKMPEDVYDEEDYANNEAYEDDGDADEGGKKQVERDEAADDDDDDEYEDAVKDAQSHEETSNEYY